MADLKVSPEQDTSGIKKMLGGYELVMDPMTGNYVRSEPTIAKDKQKYDADLAASQGTVSKAAQDIMKSAPHDPKTMYAADPAVHAATNSTKRTV